RYGAATVAPLDGIVVNHLDQIGDGEGFVCDQYKDVTLSPSDGPNLAWQSRLTEQVRRAEPVLSPAPVDSILRQLNEIAPVVGTSFGPTPQDRHFTALRFRHRQPRGS